MAIPYDFEIGKIRVDRGEFIDKGNVVVDVRHPDFNDGARGDGIRDDGISFNKAVEHLATQGGTIMVPPGSYVLTTAFTFNGQDNVVLWLMPGVVLTGAALPAATGNNFILDWRSGNINNVTGNMTLDGNLLAVTAGVNEIGTAALPFGQTYIGNAAFTASDAFLNVIRTNGSGSSDTLLAGYSYLEMTAAATGLHLGFEARISVSATTGTVTAAASMELFQVVTGAAAITSLRGLLIQSHLQTGSGVTTTYQGIRIVDPIISAGSITTVLGIDIDDITAGGTNFAIRTGLGKVEFGGDLRLGVTDVFVTLSRGGANTFNYVADAGDSLVFMAGSSGIIDLGVNSSAHLRIQGGTGFATFTGNDLLLGDIEIDGALNHDGSTMGVYSTTPISQQTGVAVSSAGIHAACVALGLFTA